VYRAEEKSEGGWPFESLPQREQGEKF